LRVGAVVEGLSATVPFAAGLAPEARRGQVVVDVPYEGGVEWTLSIDHGGLDQATSRWPTTRLPREAEQKPRAAQQPGPSTLR